MVKQTERTKNSSRVKEYRFPCSIEPVSLVPQTVELKQVDDLGPGYAEGVPGYFISGSLGDEKESLWSEPPHLAFVNLRAEDPMAAEAFTKRYGVLHRSYLADDPDREKYIIDSATFLDFQERLRRAWSGKRFDIVAWVDIEGEVEQGFDTDVRVSAGSVHLWPKHLWAAICFLFLMDSTDHKLGYCGNPDCPAPYFRKKRRTQKYCEQGPCVQYAQRQYSLGWWNREGKKRREKKAKSRGGRS